MHTRTGGTCLYVRQLHPAHDETRTQAPRDALQHTCVRLDDAHGDGGAPAAPFYTFDAGCRCSCKHYAALTTQHTTLRAN